MNALRTTTFTSMNLPWVQLIYTFKIYINKFVFKKNLSKIEKVIKTFSIPNKTFSKNTTLLRILKAHVSKNPFTKDEWKSSFSPCFLFVMKNNSCTI